MSDDEKPDSQKKPRRPGFLPSYLSSEMKEYSDNEIREAFPNLGNKSHRTETDSQQRPSGLGRVLKDTAGILVALALWGLLVGIIWPEISDVFEELYAPQEAYTPVYAMTPAELERFNRGSDAWGYLTIGGHLLVLVGLTVSACLIKQNRLRHVLAVAFVIWLINGVQVFIGTVTIQNFASAIIRYAIFSLIAVGLSFIFVRSNKNDPHSETQKGLE